ncbi:MAG: type VI secretion system baseplate subunit TssG [Desulforegulaceae bacterium]|nr:type VI secretion system baseplate subunit TssG [Desulforegulaceae bacterium]
MEAKYRQKTSDLKDELNNNPSAFSFIQAIRLLRFFHKKKPPLPEFIKKYLRITPALSLGFPGCDIKNLEIDENKDIFKITATFLGLYGSSSPLPVFYTEDLIDETNEGRSVKKDFIDIFNVVFFELFYNCVSKYRLNLKFCDENNTLYKNFLYSLLGLGTLETRNSFDLKDEMLKYLGIFLHYPRSSSGLKTIIKDFFNLNEVEITEFTKNIVNIPEDQQTILGIKNSAIGQNCHLGNKITDYSGRITIEIKDISEEDFHRFIPSGDKYIKLKKIISFYLDQPLDVKIVLAPLCQEIKPACPGSSTWSELGYNTWIFSKNIKIDNKTADFICEI